MTPPTWRRCRRQWWLGTSCVLGFGARSQTPMNVERTGECVLNLPSPALAAAVDAIALYTGSEEVPPHKLARGYACEPHEFERAGVTPVASELVSVPRVGRVGGAATNTPARSMTRWADVWVNTSRSPPGPRGTTAVSATMRSGPSLLRLDHAPVSDDPAGSTWALPGAARLGLAAGACVEHAPPRDRYENRGR